MRKKRLVALILIGVVALGGLVLVASPRGRSWLVSWFRSPSGPSLLRVGYPPLGANEKVEVLIDGRQVALSCPWKNHGPGTLFESHGETRFLFRVLKGDQVAYQAAFEAMVRPGDVLRFSIQPADKEPTGYYGPRPSCSVAALIPGVPARAWCWFGHVDYFHPNRLNVTVRPSEKSLVFKGRALRLGCRIVAERSEGPGKSCSLTLLRPWDKTMLQTILEIQDWESVLSVHPEVTHVY